MRAWLRPMTGYNHLEDNLNGCHGNYILPFFWQHGEDEERLREEMLRICASGIRAVCVESRPHPDFCGPLWWRDMDIIMDEARQRGMKVWLLDDARFPTGFANGWIRDRYPELRKTYLTERCMDVVGPLNGASIMVNQWVGNDTLVAVVAWEPTDMSSGGGRGTIDLTANIDGDLLYWDIPEGYWRVSFIMETQEEGGNPDYINPIDPDSCRVQIDAVYEPHFARYGADFGSTFAGFFSDESRIGNVRGYPFDCSVGRKRMVLPWRKGLLESLQEEFTGDVISALPALWHDSGVQVWAIRYAYMDLVTRLYGECFADQIGTWCRQHGVEYIGHIIEDNGAHTRLGCSTGHFFRSMWGQDMSGIDVVLWQLRPGYDKGNFTWKAGMGDGEFYHYELAKLGSSLAHVDTKKQGRAMCEIYGAYGWTEGLKLMKWLTDHMLVRGINWFVPHAFSPKFPDHDCPPHFYARGHNPQYRYFKLLMDYTNRICHLLNGGQHVAPVAVLYHAESEWSGDYMSVRQPLRVLMQSQLDADVLPADILQSGATVKDGLLRVGNEDYGCLVLPWAERWPKQTLEFLAKAISAELKVIFINGLPSGVSEMPDQDGRAFAAQLLVNATVVKLDELSGVVRSWGLIDAETSSVEPRLRCYHYRHEYADIWMLFNEEPYKTITTEISFPQSKSWAVYDAFANNLQLVIPVATRSQRDSFKVTLAPYESVIYIAGDIVSGASARLTHKLSCEVRLSIDEWLVSTATAAQYPTFTPWGKLVKLVNLCSPGSLPDFSGTIRYEAVFDCAAELGSNLGSRIVVDLGQVGETAEVWLNGKPLGARICGPYRFDATDILMEHSNHLTVDITNTLGYEMKDKLSKFAAQEAVGLLGPIRIEMYTAV